jgi:N6-adenosine-specific RNA methylase IME4
LLQRCESATQFWIGDWLLYGESRPEWGDAYEAAMGRFGVSRDTLQDYKRVAKAIPPPLRNARLSWWHHRETVPLAESGASTALLAEAERDNLPVAGLRRRVRQERAKLAEQPALPPSTYDLILADPPWRFGTDNESSNGRSMDVESLKAYPVPTVAAPDCVLFIWATQPRLADAVDVIRAWGFEYRSGAVWDRQRVGRGEFFNIRVEHLLVGLKGAPPVPAFDVPVENLISGPRGDHRRPDVFHGLLESMYPNAARLELFVESGRSGWKAWGVAKGQP